MDDVSGGPIYAPILDTCARYGIGASKLYELLGAKLISAKKFGKRILIDQRSVQEYFDDLPEAEIKPSHRVRQRRLHQELAAAATRADAQAILASPEYRSVIDSLARGARERFLATAQDIISEKDDE